MKGIAPSGVSETKAFRFEEKQMCPAETLRSKMSLYHCVYADVIVGSPFESACWVC